MRSSGWTAVLGSVLAGGATLDAVCAPIGSWRCRRSDGLTTAPVAPTANVGPVASLELQSVSGIACLSAKFIAQLEENTQMAMSMAGSHEQRETHDLIGSDKVEGTNVYSNVPKNQIRQYW
jgi:hypothetical protein